MSRFAIAFFASLALSGCATDPVANHETQPVPPDRVLATDYLQPREGAATVIVKRDRGLSGRACATRLSVNAQPTADLREGERVELQLPAGDYIFSVTPTGLCGGGTAETTASVRAGISAAFRIGYGAGGDSHIGPTAF